MHRGISYGTRCSSFHLLKKTDAKRRTVRHVAVAGEHAAVIIGLGKHFHPIGCVKNLPVFFLIIRFPSVRLCGAGDSDDERHIRMCLPEPQDFPRGEGVKPQRSSAVKAAIMLIVSIHQRLPDPFPDLRNLPGRQMPMSCKESRDLFGIGTAVRGLHHESIFRTARNASLGTCTVPNWRIRFFPSFCFSSSFFFRVISPP